MEGTVMLMLLVGFLAFVLYRMDQNERKEKIMKMFMESPSDDTDYTRGFRDGMQWSQKQPIDVTPTKVVRKRKK